MKQFFSSFLVFGLMVLLLSSCYTYTFSVGSGAQGNQVVTEKNHYLVYGLASVKQSDPQQMADGAENYDVTITHTFIDGLINGLTLGIYNPTTTIVTK